MNKKAQAAMEFVATYGWAILAAIIAIAVLAYFGVFSPKGITGDTIIVTAPFHAVASQLIVTASPTPQVNFEMSNKWINPVTVTAITITGTGPSDGIDCTSSPNQNFPPDTITLFIVPCTGTLNIGDPYIGDIVMTYVKSGGNLGETVSGKIKAVVQ